MKSLTGTMLGPYAILEQIGGGGMATVYKAYQPSVDRFVALKVVRVDIAEQPQFRERFHREARTIARLEHRYILPIYDFGEDEDIPYLVMRYIDGGTLGDIIARGPLPPERALRYITQVAEALAYTHVRDIIHRDIKPANILLSPDDHVLLTDFGIAKMVAATTTMTAAGMTLGTPFYMAPEQVRSQPVDARTDIYALGIVLYECLVGQPPFVAETPWAVLDMHVRDPLPSPRAANPAIDAALEHAILKATNKNSADRFQTAEEFAAALRAIPAALPTPAAPHHTPPSASQTPVLPERGELAALAGASAPVAAASSVASSLPAVLGNARDELALPSPAPPTSVEPTAGEPGPAARRGIPRWVWGMLIGIIAIALIGAAVFSRGQVAPGPEPTAPQFDALYATNFSLQALSADTIPLVSKPGVKATSLSNPSYIDPVYGTRIYRITAATDFPGATFVRHDYSRRQAFNADNSRFIATTSNGYWLLYDANTFQMLPRTGGNGALRGPAGDCEMIWHPTDPKKLWYMSGNGLIWYEKDVETDQDTVLVDFTGRLPWSQATTVWTKSEGTSSADGRYWAFMATTYDSVNQTNTIYGLFTWDRQQDKIIGTYDAANFGGAVPDHISIAPSGKYAVPSWPFIPTLGTRAFPLDFSSSIQLHTQSEHSDLAIGPNGEDYYVLTDYDSGKIRAVDIATGASFDLMALYPASGEGYAAHISGKAYDRPGWVLISTYADAADYGSTAPAPTLRPMYRKIMLVELKPGGRQLNVAHTRTADNYGDYWGEPQATINRDGSRIIFASNFNDGNPPDDYMIGLPSWIYGN